MPDANVGEIQRRFLGQAALVTGSAGGIGLAIARRLASEGCKVMLADIDASRLEAAAAGLSAQGGEVAVHVADLADATARANLVPAVIERFGGIDVLVNNAADHGPRTPFMDLAAADWERVFAVNVAAAAMLSRAAAEDMLARGDGAIVNVASVQVDLPVPTYSAYVASKGAVLAMTRALAVELSPRGIRVNAVTPGVIATDAFRAALGESGEPKPAAPTAALIAGHGTPGDVAAAVAFLASHEASFVTGATLHVDGGRSISRRPDPFEATFGRPASDGHS